MLLKMTMHLKIFERLKEAREEFAHYSSTNHGLVVENRKEKAKLEKSRNRKSMENLPMPKIWKSKFTDRVGVASEAIRLASNIRVLEKYWANASNIETSQVPLCDQYHPVSEICKKQATYDVDADHTVAVTNTIQETNFNYTITSKIITRLPSAPSSTSLLRNGCHSLTYLDLLSLESVHSTSQLEKYGSMIKNLEQDVCAMRSSIRFFIYCQRKAEAQYILAQMQR